MPRKIRQTGSAKKIAISKGQSNDSSDDEEETTGGATSNSVAKPKVKKSKSSMSGQKEQENPGPSGMRAKKRSASSMSSLTKVESMAPKKSKPIPIDNTLQKVLDELKLVKEQLQQMETRICAQQTEILDGLKSLRTENAQIKTMLGEIKTDLQESNSNTRKLCKLVRDKKRIF